jgi:hypothetical protein
LAPRPPHEGRLSQVGDRSRLLVPCVGLADRGNRDLDFTHREIFSEAKELAESYDLDLSDAFQLLSLRAGFFAALAGESKTVLVTADEKLAAVARRMKLPVWDCLRQPMPA